jgi:hypothetical protein
MVSKSDWEDGRPSVRLEGLVVPPPKSEDYRYVAYLFTIGDQLYHVRVGAKLSDEELLYG